MQSVCQTGWSQSLYFPPLNGAALWDTLSPSSLGWCTEEIQPLYDYLQEQNSKAFIVLRDGRIVLEKYFDAFTRDSIWYWASAGKTLTSFLVGKAQEEGFLSIDDPSAAYLGAGWTSCDSLSEQAITIRHQLTMTSGLDDGVADNHCLLDTCLQCLATPGTRWAYHNAPYTLLEGVLENATGMPINTYTQTRLKNLTGMNGLWLTLGYDNVYFSNARSMARFGLLMQNDGVWNATTVMEDTAYLHQMTRTSQNLNRSYGYLWWLNGKPSFMLPTLQFVFPGSLAPHAPPDMFAGIGKNGQIVCVSKSKGLVLIRMGNATSEGEVPILFLDRVWEYIDAIRCGSTAVQEPDNRGRPWLISPNPTSDWLTIDGLAMETFSIAISDMTGRELIRTLNRPQVDVSSLPCGIYAVSVLHANGVPVGSPSRFIRRE